MSTRSTITVKCSDGKYRGIYCHFDGYLSGGGVGYYLINYYNSAEKAEELVSNGDASSIDETIMKCDFYSIDRCGEGVEAREADSLEELPLGYQSYDYVWDGNNWSVCSFTSNRSKPDLKHNINDEPYILLEYYEEDYVVEDFLKENCPDGYSIVLEDDDYDEWKYIKLDEETLVLLQLRFDIKKSDWIPIQY